MLSATSPPGARTGARARTSNGAAVNSNARRQAIG